MGQAGDDFDRKAGASLELGYPRVEAVVHRPPDEQRPHPLVVVHAGAILAKERASPREDEKSRQPLRAGGCLGTAASGDGP